MSDSKMKNGGDTVDPLLTPTTTVTTDATATPSSDYRTYKRRWLVLAVVSLLNWSNVLQWIAYATVANLTDEFYGKGTTNLLSMIFLAVTIPIALLAMYGVGRFGLRFAILIAGWTNAIGAILKLISAVDSIPSTYQYILVLLGQSISGCAYPFIMFLPTKVAADWFPDNQRAIANTIATMSNPLGILIANVLFPPIILHVDHIIRLSAICAVPCAIVCALGTVFIRTSIPPIPPTAGAAQNNLGFVSGMRRALSSRNFLLLFVTLGGGIGMLNALYATMQQILCSKGYSNQFSGICCALIISGGLIGATVSGIVVDRTHRFEEVMKLAFGGCILMGIAFAQVALRPSLQPLVALACLFFGFFGMAGYPVGLELGAECTFPVAETTSTGLIVLAGQIMGVIFIIVMSTLSQPITTVTEFAIEVCSVTETAGKGGVTASNMTRPLLVFVSVGTLMICTFIVLFKPKLRRIKHEKSAAAGLIVPPVETQKFGIIEMKVIHPKPRENSPQSHTESA